MAQGTVTEHPAKDDILARPLGRHPVLREAASLRRTGRRCAFCFQAKDRGARSGSQVPQTREPGSKAQPWGEREAPPLGSGSPTSSESVLREER